jgi:hypothetical protein
VARRDTVLVADGAALSLEKVSPPPKYVDDRYIHEIRYFREQHRSSFGPLPRRVLNGSLPNLPGRQWP